MTETDAGHRNQLAEGHHPNPHAWLGMHPVQGSMVVRAWQPGAAAVSLLDPDSSEPLPMNAQEGGAVFTLELPEREERFPYRLSITAADGHPFEAGDPYRFWPTLSDYDLHLFNEGTHHKAYERLGCHLMVHEGEAGVAFAVWAPSAGRVSVVGTFNNWDGTRHPMRRMGASGVWELFIPDLCKGDVYKYEILTPSGELYLKADPYAFYAEHAPNTASVVWDLQNHEWRDRAWMTARTLGDPFKKAVNIYEIHAGSWRQARLEEPVADGGTEQVNVPVPIVDERKNIGETGFRLLTWRELAARLIPYLVEMHYTHVELMPVMEHPFDGSWGYQVTGFYAPTARYGTPEDLKFFIDACHQASIGVILDWVPAHFPKDGHGLARFDGTGLYEHEDPRQGEHEQWGTHIFNFGRREVSNFLIANAVYWFEQFHVDGLRVDAVASMLYLDYARPSGDWLPNRYGGRENIAAIAFIRQLNHTVYRYFTNVMMIAEESTSWPLVTKPVHDGGLGFSHKWNMGWMNDFLKYLGTDTLARKYHQNLITFSLMYAFSENYVLVLSHDEVVHGKKSLIGRMPGDFRQQFAGLRAAYGFFFGHPGKKLLFMGSEFGQYIEWRYKYELDWLLLDYELHRQMKDCVKELNRLYVEEKALHEVDHHYEGFEWIDCTDTDHSIATFLRKGSDWKDMLLVVCNFSTAGFAAYRVGAPLDTTYTEIFNSDDSRYGGGGRLNATPVPADPIPWQRRPYSLTLGIPPLTTLILRPDTTPWRVKALS